MYSLSNVKQDVYHENGDDSGNATDQVSCMKLFHKKMWEKKVVNWFTFMEIFLSELWKRSRRIVGLGGLATGG